MEATAPKPAKAVAETPVTKQRFRTSPLLDGGADGNDKPPSTHTGQKAQAESATAAWHDAIKKVGRLALLIPVTALLVFLCGQGNSGLFPWTSAEVVRGTRELLTVGLAMMIARLARDTARLVAMRGWGKLALDLTDGTKITSFVGEGFLRPVDLAAASQPDDGTRHSILRTIENWRGAFVLLITAALSLAVCSAMASSIHAMFGSPGGSPTPSQLLALLSLAFCLLALLDVSSALIAGWPQAWRLKRDWDAEVDGVRKRSIALPLDFSLPSHWAPRDRVALKAFQKAATTAEAAKQIRLWSALPALAQLVESRTGKPLISPLKAFDKVHQRAGQLPKSLEPEVAFTPRESPDERVDRLMREFQSEYDAADFLPERPKPWDHSYRNRQQSAEDFEQEITRVRRELAARVRTYDLWNWCRREADSLDPILRIPTHIDYGDLDVVWFVAEEVRLAKWVQEGKVWIDSEGWQPATSVGLSSFAGLAALWQVLADSHRHPRPFASFLSRLTYERWRRSERSVPPVWMRDVPDA